MQLCRECHGDHQWDDRQFLLYGRIGGTSGGPTCAILLRASGRRSDESAERTRLGFSLELDAAAPPPPPRKSKLLAFPSAEERSSTGSNPKMGQRCACKTRYASSMCQDCKDSVERPFFSLALSPGLFFYLLYIHCTNWRLSRRQRWWSPLCPTVLIVRSYLVGHLFFDNRSQHHHADTDNILVCMSCACGALFA